MDLNTFSQVGAFIAVLIGGIGTTIWRSATAMSALASEIQLMRMEMTYVKAELKSLVVTQKHTGQRLDRLSTEVEDVRERSYNNVLDFHRKHND